MIRNFKELEEKLKTLKFKKDSISDVLRELIIEKEILSTYMTSKEISEIVFTKTGRKIPPKDISFYLRSFHKNKLINCKEIEGKAIWFLPWLNPEITKKDEIYKDNDPYVIFEALKLHPEIKKVSGSLFKTGHYSPSIFEAFKLVNIYVRKKSGLKDKDGTDLMHSAFNENNPILMLNPLKSLYDKDEQQGFRFIFVGSMQGIRNPKAHEIKELKDPQKALEYLSLASLLLKIVDDCKKKK